jgi:hypothetical protein
MTLTLFGEPGGGGTCVPARSLLRFTCTPGGTPVLAAGGRRTFLGGSWARPVTPTGTPVTVRGRASASTSVDVNAGTWMSRRADGFVRLFPLTNEAALPRPPQADAIGDSVMVDAAPALRRALPGWNVAVDAQVGDTTFVGLRVAAGLRGRRGEVVFVELGTNESDVAGFAQRATQMLNDLSGAGLVVWLTVHSPTSYAPAINDAIRRVVAGAPNAVVADWDRIAPSGGFVGDGIHLDQRGMQAMAAMLAPLAKRWRTAAAGGGPLSCRTRAEALAAS